MTRQTDKRGIPLQKIQFFLHRLDIRQETFQGINRPTQIITFEKFITKCDKSLSLIFRTLRGHCHPQTKETLVYFRITPYGSKILKQSDYLLVIFFQTHICQRDIQTRKTTLRCG